MANQERGSNLTPSPQKYSMRRNPTLKRVTEAYKRFKGISKTSPEDKSLIAFLLTPIKREERA